MRVQQFTSLLDYMLAVVRNLGPRINVDIYVSVDVGSLPVAQCLAHPTAAGLHSKQSRTEVREVSARREIHTGVVREGSSM